MPIIFFTYGEFLKKKFYYSKEKELPFVVRVIGANISLDRYYKNINAETVINELILNSSPNKEKKIFFVCPPLPNVQSRYKPSGSEIRLSTDSFRSIGVCLILDAPYYIMYVN